MTEGRSEKGEEGTPLIPYKASGLPLSSTFLGQGSYHLSLQSVTFRSKHFSFFFFFCLLRLSAASSICRFCSPVRWLNFASEVLSLVALAVV